MAALGLCLLQHRDEFRMCCGFIVIAEDFLGVQRRASTQCEDQGVVRHFQFVRDGEGLYEISCEVLSCLS